MVTLEIVGGPTIEVDWSAGMNVQDLLQDAYDNASAGEFSYSIEYYGSDLGYLVNMINETYDTYTSSGQPYFFWQFSVNGTVSSTGIDSTELDDGDVVSFNFTRYIPDDHANTLTERKYMKRTTFNA